MVLKEYILFSVSSSGDTGTKRVQIIFQYLLVEIESSGGDGGTNKVQLYFGIFLWR